MTILFENIRERSGPNICYLVGPAWIANHCSFFNEALWLKNYICNGYSFQKSESIFILQQQEKDYVFGSNSPIFSAFILCHFKTISFAFNMFWKFWLVFEYFLEPGINIRNIWLTRPHLAGQQTAGTKFCKIFKYGKTHFLLKVHLFQHSSQRSHGICRIEGNCLNLPFALENSEVKSQSGKHYHYGWSHSEQLDFYTIWASNRLNHTTSFFLQFDCILEQGLLHKSVLNLNMQVKLKNFHFWSHCKQP